MAPLETCGNRSQSQHHRSELRRRSAAIAADFRMQTLRRRKWIAILTPPLHIAAKIDHYNCRFPYATTDGKRL